jgi:hypothetical protein
MPRIRITPPAVFWPVWKVLFVGSALSGSITLTAWGLKSLALGHQLPMTVFDFLLGCGFLLLLLLNRWTWRLRKKHLLWYDWLLALTGTMYFNGLFLGGAIVSWTSLLNYPWNWVVKGILVAFVILVWAMPLLSYPTAKKLSQIPWALSGSLLPFTGVAGAAGAVIGIYGYRHGQSKLVLGVAGSLFFLLAFLAAASSAQDFWDSRPWAKDGAE